MTTDEFKTEHARCKEAAWVLEQLETLKKWESTISLNNGTGAFTFARYSDGTNEVKFDLHPNVVQEIVLRLIRREIASLQMHFEEL